jgi:CRISPR type III-A-associated RAMP protein Csm4
MALIEVRLRPTGPWRVGYRGGDRERVDVVYHSDALFSALTHAMRALGWMDEWLAATVGTTDEPAVRLSSLFPFIGKTRLVPPPKSVWPPAGRGGQLYLDGAKLVPLEVLRQGLQEESRWEVDGECQCLLPSNGTAPFRVVVRESAAVDRITGAAESHRTACLEFAPNAGWWGVFSTTDKTWETRVKAALRLAADSGFGGERSRGWGRSAEPQFNDATHLFPAVTEGNDAWWLLSLYSPAESDDVNWTRSEHAITLRGGWTDSAAGVSLKKQVRMVEEGSVISAGAIRGRAVDVAPEGFAHPVYRSGLALAVPVQVLVEPPAKKKTLRESVPTAIQETPMPGPDVLDPTTLPDPSPVDDPPEPSDPPMHDPDVPGITPDVDDPPTPDENEPFDPPVDDPIVDPVIYPPGLPGEVTA